MANVVHSTLTGTDLHEPKGVASASSGEVYVANGGGSGVWTAPDPVVFMQKHIAGLTYSNAADATNDFTILSGSCRDSTNTEDMILSASITKRIDAAWVVGDNQGGLDTGAVANTTYHIWLIKRTDTDVVDVLFSTSATAPTMPTNYDKKRRIGSFQRIAGVNQSLLVQESNGGGLIVYLKTGQTSQTLNLTSSQTSYVVTGLPTGVALNTNLKVSGTNTQNAWIGPVGVTSYDSNVPPLASFTMFVLSNTSGQVSSDNMSGGTEDISISLLGWDDFRRD